MFETENFRILGVYIIGHPKYRKCHTRQIYLRQGTASLRMALHRETILVM